MEDSLIKEEESILQLYTAIEKLYPTRTTHKDGVQVLPLHSYSNCSAKHSQYSILYLKRAAKRYVLTQILALLNREEFLSSQIIIEPTTPSPYLSLLIAGQAKKIDDSQHTIYNPGSWFGNIRELTGAKYTHLGIISTTNAVVYRIAIKDMTNLINDLNSSSIISERIKFLETYNDMLRGLGLRSKQRIANFFIEEV